MNSNMVKPGNMNITDAREQNNTITIRTMYD